ncbi:MAG: HAMP domain-containing histidine kinase [Cyclobacteriaceae bacterium]|nr:HAMP domain-containing histidine kinase [Cyclobacteriaceae bacterium]
MNIRQKILLSFSSVTIVLLGVSFIVIYTLFAEYREEEFQQRLKEKMTSTLNFIEEAQKINASILQALERVTLNEAYEEKILLFDEDKKLIYSSIDDLKITFAQSLLNDLNAENNWIETKSDDYDIVAVHLNFQNDQFYGISMAYDNFGYSKLRYLKYVLLVIFFIIAFTILIVTFYISRQISLPINTMAVQIENLTFDSADQKIEIPNTRDEIHVLAVKFNELMKRLNEAFAFQKHVVHHISHELKTPIAVLVSNFERIEHEQDTVKIRQFLKLQKEDTKHLADIINALLDIARAESGTNIKNETVRVDDLIFDTIEKLKIVYPQGVFLVEIANDIESEDHLIVTGNRRLLTAAFSNLLTNAIHYSSDGRVKIQITANVFNVNVGITNAGETIADTELPFMFQHFFRGENSRGKRGFGLGLVLINRIITLHAGTVAYQKDNNLNIFRIKIPLS